MSANFLNRLQVPSNIGFIVISLSGTTSLSGKIAVFPDENYNLAGLSVKWINFPDEMHNWTDLSGNQARSPDDNVKKA